MGNLFSLSRADTLNLCFDFIAPRLNHTSKLKRNLKALNDASQELRELRDDVKQEVERAKRRRLEPLNQVQGWLGRAETMIREADELSNHGPQEIDSLLLGGYISRNFMSSYQFGQQVAMKLDEVIDQKRKGVFEKVAQNELGGQLDPRPIASTVGLEAIFDKVWSLLENNDVGIVGLYGPGGVGKTTLLIQINNKLSSLPTCYDVLIWVTVSKDYLVEKVQDQIGEKIDLFNELWKKKSCDEKATEIFRVLSEKKFVLLLDDLWNRVDLVKVGIPPLNIDGSSNSKLVFTTRSQDVCGEMEAHEKIRVACLGEDDAWKLFQEKIGEQILKGHPEIEELAKRVAAECGGLPLALITIGRAMASKKSPQEWEYAIEILERAAYKFTQLEDEVYPLLKFSYDSLPSDAMRSCLLYCSLYPEDYIIGKKCLIDYWFYEGFLDEFQDINKAHMQGYNILGSLVNACLLEEIEQGQESYVKMHDVIRDMTFWIAGGCEAAESRVNEQDGIQLIEGINVGTWEGVKRVSLRVQNQIKDLRTAPTCPNLLTLFLNDNKFEVISDGFFQFMPNLKVLNLSWNRELRELPEGISELVSLECLDLSWTDIRVLPNELKTLEKLQYLDLWHTPVRIIPQQLISSFPKLQVIKMFLLDVWVLDDGNEDIIDELGCLQHLKSGSFKIESVFALEKLLSFPNLKRCTQQLDLYELREKFFNVLYLAYMEGLQMLDIHYCDMEKMKMTKIPYQLATDACFGTLGDVTLFGCDKLKEVTWLVLATNLTSLEVLDCSKMEEIIGVERLSDIADLIGNQYPIPFRKLQSLNLRCLTKLKSIYWDSLPFPFLKCMHVEYCPNLRKLPLNSASAKGNQITIQGKKDWWEKLEWEDESIRNAFLPCFKEL